MKNVALVTILLCLSITCSRYDVDRLLAAPEKIEIDGREYVLDAGLVRDFMPGEYGREGSPLYAGTEIIAVDSQPFPSVLDADSMYVVNDGDVWAVTLIDAEPPPAADYKIRKRAEDEGPRWGPGIYVDVVVRLVDPDGAYLLRQSHVKIQAVQ